MPPEVGQLSAEVVQAAREIRKKGIGPVRRQRAIDVDCLLGGRERRLTPPEFGQASADRPSPNP